MKNLFKFLKLRTAFRDIKNYFVLVSKVKELRKTPEWAQYNLKHDWFYRIYTIIQLRKEDTGEDKEIREYRLKERVKPISDFLFEHNLHEIIQIKRREWMSEGIYVYLIIFAPLFYQLTFWYVITRLCLGYLIYLLIKVLYINGMLDWLITFLTSLKY